jgi:hypothetical protein
MKFYEEGRTIDRTGGTDQHVGPAHLIQRRRLPHLHMLHRRRPPPPRQPAHKRRCICCGLGGVANAIVSAAQAGFGGGGGGGGEQEQHAKARAAGRGAAGGVEGVEDLYEHGPVGESSGTREYL